MFLGQEIAELKFLNRTSEFARIAELKIANKVIIKKICKIPENKTVILN